MGQVRALSCFLHTVFNPNFESSIRKENMKFIFLLTIFFTAHQGFSNEINGKVVVIVDGNTIDVESAENGIQRIVLAGIDCPELEQEYGDAARKFLEKLVYRKNVSVQLLSKDRFGNYVGVVRLSDDQDVRVELLKAGLAWTRENDPDETLDAYRKWAQQKGKGLWKNPDATAPWTFRRQQSMVQPKSS